MQTDLEELESAREELSEVRNLVVDHLLVIDVVVGLEVDASVCHEEDSIDFDERQYLLHVELSLELCQLTDVLEATLVELNLLVGHYSASHIPLRRVVQALGHPG